MRIIYSPPRSGTSDGAASFHCAFLLCRDNNFKHIFDALFVFEYFYCGNDSCASIVRLSVECLS